MSANDLNALFEAEEAVRRWTAEWENASARMQLAKHHRNIRCLLSQADPFKKYGINREQMRAIFSYIGHGDMARLERDLGGAQEIPVGSTVCWKSPAPWEEGMTGIVRSYVSADEAIVEWNGGLKEQKIDPQWLVVFK